MTITVPTIPANLTQRVADAYTAAGTPMPRTPADLVREYLTGPTLNSVRADLMAEMVILDPAKVKTWTTEALARITAARAAEDAASDLRMIATRAELQPIAARDKALADLAEPFTQAVATLTTTAKMLPRGARLDTDAAYAAGVAPADLAAAQQAARTIVACAGVHLTPGLTDLPLVARLLAPVLDIPKVPLEVRPVGSGPAHNEGRLKVTRVVREFVKATRPTQDPDPLALVTAVARGDYAPMNLVLHPDGTGVGIAAQRLDDAQTFHVTNAPEEAAQLVKAHG